MLTAIAPQSITAANSGDNASGSGTTTARWFLWNALLPAIDTFRADGSQVVAFYFGDLPLLFLAWSPSGQLTGFGLGAS